MLGLGNSDSRSTLAQKVMQTHVCARNFGDHYCLEEIEVVCFPNVSGLHVLSCLVHENLCFVPNILDTFTLIYVGGGPMFAISFSVSIELL